MRQGDYISFTDKHIKEVLSGGGYVERYRQLMDDILRGRVENRFKLSSYNGSSFDIDGYTWKNMSVNLNRITEYKERLMFMDNSIFTL